MSDDLRGRLSRLAETDPWALRNEAHHLLYRAEQAETLNGLVSQILALFAKADIHNQLFWQVEDGAVRFYANVSDVFDWGTADHEEITAARVTELHRAYDDLAAIDAAEYTAELFAARVRKMRPQGAAYPDNPAARALFDECGPERPTGLTNPREPAALDQPEGLYEDDEPAEKIKAAFERGEKGVTAPPRGWNVTPST